MNQMTSALAQAGVSLPTSQQRIWNYVKDHPCVTAKRVQLELKLPGGTVSALLAQMTARGMMRSEKKRLRVPVGSKYVNRAVSHYSAVGDNYDPDRHPCVVKKQTKVSPMVEPVNKPGLREMLVERIERGPIAAQDTVNSLTVAQARELWLVLNRMFGSVK